LDGKRIFFKDLRNNIGTVSLEDGTEHQMTDLESRPGSHGSGLATDGTYLYFSWGRSLMDLWVMDIVRE